MLFFFFLSLLFLCLYPVPYLTFHAIFLPFFLLFLSFKTGTCRASAGARGLFGLVGNPVAGEATKCLGGGGVVSRMPHGVRGSYDRGTGACDGS